ncbi:MAG: molybdenum cofactor guanylyltransferase [Desulfobacterales bacterium]|nr:molybdenum cofactor guanylyltransferase [Desulfobacterales bacterium]
MTSNEFYKPSCAGVILAGGLNLRFNGENKALATVGKNNIIENTLRLFRDLFEEIIIVTNTPLLFSQWDVTIVTDIFPIQSPLTGIYSALFYASAPHIFVSACDTPFLQEKLVKVIIDNIDTKADIFIPATEKGLEPLCAAYAKKCMVPIERMLLAHLQDHGASAATQHRILKKSLKIQNFFNKVRIKPIGEDQLRAADASLVSFFNVNTPEDLANALKMLPQIKKESL